MQLKKRNRLSTQFYNNPREINENIFYYCMNHLTRKNQGYMRDTVKHAVEEELSLKIGILKLNGIPVSWCLEDFNGSVQIYTNSRYRNKGFAKKLLHKFMQNFKIRSIKLYPDFYEECKKPESYRIINK